MSAIFGTKFDTVVAFEWPRHSHPNVGQLIFVGPRDRLVSDNVRLNGVLFSSQGLTKERPETQEHQIKAGCSEFVHGNEHQKKSRLFSNLRLS